MQMKRVLAIGAQIAMTLTWLLGESGIDALLVRVFDNELLIDTLRALSLVTGMAVYVIGLRLVIGKIYDIDNGKGVWTWLRLIIRPSR